MGGYNKIWILLIYFKPYTYSICHTTCPIICIPLSQTFREKNRNLCWSKTNSIQYKRVHSSLFFEVWKAAHYAEKRRKKKIRKKIIITKYDRAQVYQFYEFPHLLAAIIMLIISYFWYAAGQFLWKKWNTRLIFQQPDKTLWSIHVK